MLSNNIQQPQNDDEKVDGDIEAFEDEDQNFSEVQDESGLALGELIAMSWKTRKHKLEHVYTMTGWAFSMMLEV